MFKKELMLFLALFFLFFMLFGCDKGKTKEEIVLSSVSKLSDSEIIAVGYSTVDLSEEIKNHGNSDILIVKFDENGNIIWQNLFGTKGFDKARVVRKTKDGGFVIGAYSSADILIMKFGLDGKIQWKRNIGGTKYEDVSDILETSDNGYIVVGISESNDKDIEDNLGSFDYLVAKLNNNGEIDWIRNYGGSINDYAKSVVEVDDGYIVAGYSYSKDWDISKPYKGADIWIIKLDRDGYIVWDKSYGGDYSDKCYSILEDNDYFMIFGTTNSHLLSKNTNDMDIYVLKINDSGEFIWQKTFGNSITEGFKLVIKDEDNYLVSAYAFNVDEIIKNEAFKDNKSVSEDVEQIYSGHYVPWLFKIDSKGNFLNQVFLDEGSDAEIVGIVKVSEDDYLVFENIMETTRNSYNVFRMSKDLNKIK